MEFKFEKLIIWQKAMDFGEEINTFTDKFPPKEVYNLSSQIRRAVDSIALNISEGSIGQSDPEFKKFMGYAIRSLAEVITCLHKAKRREYISEAEFLQLYEYDDRVYKKHKIITNLRTSVSRLRSLTSDFGLPSSDNSLNHDQQKNFY